ncbi:hypothetical protein JW949_00075 [Candidatus Woesearchaeota archaeon]|nr:hypothetical protein [Candidatus Woesearchaeota archaeon]
MKPKNMFWILMIILILSSLHSVSAFENSKKGYMPLLSVYRTEDNKSMGKIAHLYLEIKPGNGDVYLDTFPLSELDTQITVRFANRLACKYTNKDCNQYDFFYKIRSDSTTVGGPSAGASVAVLTIAMLDNLNLNEKAVMTGTINSGYVIGPVGEIKEKIRAAEKEGFEKVIIPKWQHSTNTSFNITDINTEVIETGNLDQAVYEFTGKNFSKKYEKTEIPEEYSRIMSSVAESLCENFNRAAKEYENKRDNETVNKSFLRYESGIKSIEEGRYYSGASYCFSANLLIDEIIINEMPEESIKEKYEAVKEKLIKLKNKINSIEIKSLQNLETFMVVSERIDEAMMSIEEYEEEGNNSKEEIAYAVERYNSALYWSEFFEWEGREIELDEESLKDTCLKKIYEAQEIDNYIYIYFREKPGEEKIEQAKDDYRKGDYELCIYRASKSKAQSSLIMTALLIKENETKMLLDEKIESAEKVIAEQASKGNFPIIGYSYYEYASSLKDEDASSGLLYSEYALELSNLDMYFKETEEKSFLEKIPRITIRINNYNITALFVFFLGISVGGFIVFIIMRNKNPVKDHKPRKSLEKERLPGKKR